MIMDIIPKSNKKSEKNRRKSVFANSKKRLSVFKNSKRISLPTQDVRINSQLVDEQSVISNYYELDNLAVQDQSATLTETSLAEGRLTGSEATHAQDDHFILNKQLSKVSSTAKLVRFITLLILFLGILTSATLSKVCLIAVTARLHHAVYPTILSSNQSTSNPTNTTTSTIMTNITDPENASIETSQTKSQPSSDSVALADQTLLDVTRTAQCSISFVQLVIILVSCQLTTVIRMLFGAINGKSSITYPWPSLRATICGIFVSFLESAALCAFVIFGALIVEPLLLLFLLSGIYLFTGIYDILGFCRKDHRFNRGQHLSHFYWKMEKYIFNSPAASMLGSLLQIIGLIVAGLAIVQFPNIPLHEESHITISYMVVLLFAVILLSITWSRPVQKCIFRHKRFISKKNDKVDNQYIQNGGLPASRKGGLIYAFVRLLVIPFIAYGFARLAGIDVDPSLGFSGWTSEDLAVLLVQVLCSLATMFLSLVALLATVQKLGFTLPLLLSTPAAVGWYWIAQIDGANLFPFYRETDYFISYHTAYYATSVVPFSLLLGALIILGTYIWKSPIHRVAKEKSFLLSPYYDNVFLDSFLLLNRYSAQVEPWSGPDWYRKHGDERKPAVFICSTMYREAEHEMTQMLSSIYRVAEALKQARLKRDHFFNDVFGRAPYFESHVFFDGALTQSQFGEFALQLMSLVSNTLHIELEQVRKTKTPYGYELFWQVGMLPFFIHFKDNTKVKNKKRWSQVMYMNYVINFRMKELDDLQRKKFDPHTSYILTTDADIHFKADAVAALLDFLSHDEQVGAVCARTHPIGTGPLGWYQVFEYAFGHWFQKSAEHVLGCVLCCPGCFAVFRAKALTDVLETYSSQVTSAAEFLTKDMGEDRWLCTLLIESGWRLEYAALSENSTYCPESFNEFFNQRRRWVPSTMANLMQLIANSGKIAGKNDSISYLFVLYQVIIIFSTAVSPATVILIVASGLFTAYQVNVHISIGILSAISVLYGLVCIYFPEKIQLGIAKVLTVAFVIIMAAAFTGIVAETFSFLQPSDNPNATIESEFIEAISVDAVYLWGFSLIVIICGLMHPSEFLVLLHFVWYILALPSAYLLLLIYSAGNLNNRSWGTRVGTAEKKKTSQGTKYDEFMAKMKSCWSSAITPCIACIKRKVSRRINEDKDPELQPEVKDMPKKESPKHLLEKSSSSASSIVQPPIHISVIQWLSDLRCEDYIRNFEDYGYTHKEFIYGMKPADLEAIGVKKEGFILRLTAAIKTIPTPICLGRTSIPNDVADFLVPLNLSQYLHLFEAEGYYLKEDVVNLPFLSKEKLVAMGITKRAHLNMLLKALNTLHDPTNRDREISDTRIRIENAPEMSLTVTDPSEETFWDDLIERHLRPTYLQGGNTDELKEGLEELRNTTLIAMAVINLLWMVLLLSFDLEFLKTLGLEESLLPVLFAGLYFGILLVQFIALIFHRLETVIHVVASAG